MRELLRLLPHLVRLVGRLAVDPRLPGPARIALVALAAYLLSPVDLVPDFLPVVGVLDDVLVAAIVIDGLLNHVERELVLAHWPGDAASLDRVGAVASRLAAWVPARVKRRLFAAR